MAGTCQPLTYDCNNPLTPAMCSVNSGEMASYCGAANVCGYCLPDVNGQNPKCVSFDLQGDCGDCTANSDCTAEPGGYCATSCCAAGSGVCVYPSLFCNH